MFRSRVAEHYRVRGYRIREDVKVRGRSGSIHHCDMVAEGPLGALVIGFGDESGFEGPELGAVRRAAQDMGAAPVAAAPLFAPQLYAAARQFGVTLLDEEALAAPTPARPQESAPESIDHPWPDPELPPARDTARSSSRSAAAAAGNGAVLGLWKHPKTSGRAATDAGAEPESHTAGAAWPPEADTQKTEAGSLPASGTPPSVAGSLPAPDDSGTDAAPVPRSPGDRRSSFAWLHGEAKDAAGASRAATSMRTSTMARQNNATLDDVLASAPPARSTPPAPEPSPPRRIVTAPIHRTAAAPPQRAFPWRWVIGPVVYGVVTGLVLFLFAVLFL